jgi:hypothetical protein
MNRTIARLSAVLVAGVGAACGGHVVVDGSAQAGSTASGSGGATSSGTGGAGAGGCNADDHTIDITDFDVSCTTTSDCVNVFIGNLCGNCLCPFSAINVADKAKYAAEQQAKAVPPQSGVCSCPAIPAVCVQGQCTVQPP